MSRFEGIFGNQSIRDNDFMVIDGNTKKNMNNKYDRDLKRYPSNLKEGSSDLVNDISFDDTLKLVTLENSDLRIAESSAVNSMYDFNHIVTDIQRNTNFNKHQHHSSEAYSKKHNSGNLEFTKLYENSGAHHILHGSESDLVKQKSSNDLFEKFSKRLSKVAIKSEMKVLIKHISKKIIKELTNKKDRDLRRQQRTSQRFFSSLESQVKYENKNVADSVSISRYSSTDIKFVSDSVLVVESNLDDVTDREDSVDKEIQDLLQNRGSMTIDLNASTPLNANSESLGDLVNSSKTAIPTPRPESSRRTMATSPILIPVKSDDLNKRSSSLLNCISRQNDDSNVIIKSTIIKQKHKSASRSIFQRLFSKDKFDGKEFSSRETPAYFTTVYQNLEDSESLINNCQSNISSPITFMDSEVKNDWLEIEDPMKQVNRNSQFENVQRASSIQNMIRKPSKHCIPKPISTVGMNSKSTILDKTSGSEISSHSGAVFIID